MKTREIYFLRAKGMGGIKIGCSTDVSSRIVALQRHSIAPLYLMGKVPGTMAQESEIHALFHKQRMHGEWFKADRALSSFVRATLAAGIIILPSVPAKKRWQRKNPSEASLQRAREFGDLYKSGQTLQEIGDKNGISRERVRQIIGLIGISGGHNQSVEIAARIAKVKVQKVLRDKQIMARRQERLEKTSLRNTRVVQMYKSGKRYSDISRECGVGVTHISKILHAENIAPNRLGT